MNRLSKVLGGTLTVITATDAEVSDIVEPLFAEYGSWVADRLEHDAGITFTEADQAHHHAVFRAELPRLRSARGRLLVARLDGRPVGVAALKPVDDAVAEIKRMYVRPAARGVGVGRALLTRLVRDAELIGYHTVRLETLRFMTTALAMYRVTGFVETPLFDGSEVAGTELATLTTAMRLDLQAGSPARSTVGAGRHARERW